MSNYLTNLLSGSAGSTQLTYAQLAAQAAGSANAQWLSGIRPYVAGNTTVNPLGTFSGSGSYRYGSAPAAPTVTYPSTADSSSRGISTDWMFKGQGSDVNTPITSDQAKGIQVSSDIDAISYSASINDEPRANGPITTLLDLVNRDQQENDLFPLRTEITWFARDTERRLLPFTPTVKKSPYAVLVPLVNASPLISARLLLATCCLEPPSKYSWTIGWMSNRATCT